MSNEEDKLKRSKRRLKTKAAARKQQKIAARFEKDLFASGMELGRFAKHHALDCGNSRCTVCGNLRRTFGYKTYQEEKLEQDLDNPRAVKGFIETD